MPASIPSPVASQADVTFRSIQALRCVAALLVLVFHASVYHPGDQIGSARPPFDVGNAGVDIFFVISGFVMWMTTNRKPTAPGVFLRHRFVRLVPIYWLFTLLMFCIVAMLPSAFSRAVVNPTHLLLSLAFFPHLGPDGSLLPLLGQGWTLNFEMFFYIIFAAALMLSARRRIWAIAGALLGLAGLGVVLADYGLTPEVQPLAVLLSPLLIEFLAGILLAWVVGSGMRLPPVWCWAVMLCGVAILSFEKLPPYDDDMQRLVRYGVPAFLIVGGAVGAELGGWLKVGRSLMLLGAASYSTYLTHTFVISALGRLWEVAGLGALPIAAAVIASLIVGVAVYLIVERPLTGMLKKQPRRAAGKALLAL